MPPPGDDNSYAGTVVDTFVFCGSCNCSSLALLQATHVHCAVRLPATQVPFCRERLAAAVVARCHGLGERHAGVDARSKQDVDVHFCTKKSLIEVAHLFAAVRDDGLTLVRACSGNGIDDDPTFQNIVCECDATSFRQIDDCICSEGDTLPVPALPAANKAVRQGDWPHVMIIWGHGMDRLDSIMSFMQAQQGISIIRIETIDYSEYIRTIVHGLFAQSFEHHPGHAFLSSVAQYFTLVYFIDHQPVLSLYREVKNGRDGFSSSTPTPMTNTFANKRVIDMKRMLRSAHNPNLNGKATSNHILHVTNMPADVDTILASFPGGKWPSSKTGYGVSHTAFFIPPFIPQHLVANTPYTVEIVDISVLRVDCKATKGTVIFGTMPTTYDSRHFGMVSVECPRAPQGREEHRESFLRTLTGTVDLFLYPRCVHTHLGGHARRSYVIVDESFNVLDGSHKVFAAVSSGATRMEVVTLGKNGTVKPHPCVGVMDTLNMPTPAVKVSLGLRTLMNCNIRAAVAKVTNPDTFPTSVKLGESINIVTNHKLKGVVSCLLSVFPAARISMLDDSYSHAHMEILHETGNREYGVAAVKDSLFLRFNFLTETHFVSDAASSSISISDVLKRADTHVSPLGLTWQAPNLEDETLIRFSEWRKDLHEGLNSIEDLQWIASHPSVMFPLPFTRTKRYIRAGQTNGIVQLSEPACLLASDRSQTGEAIPLQIIIFSKDRPSQLLLLLQSLERYVIDWMNVPITVIVTTSNEHKVHSYILVQRKFQCVRFLWHKEQRLFYKHLEAVLSNNNPEFTLTLTDNNVFVRQVSLFDMAYAAKFDKLSFLSVGLSIPMSTNSISEVKKYLFAKGHLENSLVVWGIGRLSDKDTNTKELNKFFSLARSVYRTQDLKQILQHQANTYKSFSDVRNALTQWHTMAVDRTLNLSIGILGTQPSVSLTPEILDVRPLDLHLIYRFDIIVKTVYAIEYVKYGQVSALVRNIYLEHLRVWNNFTEPCTFEGEADWFDTTKSCVIKSSANDFEMSFQRTLDDLRQNGFDSTISLVPVSNSLYPLNGAHRVAAAIALEMETMPVQKTQSEKWFKWDENFFVEKGFNLRFVDTAWARFREHTSKNADFILDYLKRSKDNIHAVVLFPSIRNMLLDKVKALLSEFTNTITERTFWLSTKYAADMFVQQIYPDEQWVSGGAWGKTSLCFPEGTESFPVRVMFVATLSPLSDIMRAKAHIRELYKIGKSSIHISDTNSQAIDIAKLVLNTNSLAYINETKWSSPSQRKRIACQSPDSNDSGEKYRYYLDGKPCALGAVDILIKSLQQPATLNDWSLYAQSKLLRDMSRGH